MCDGDAPLQLTKPMSKCTNHIDIAVRLWWQETIYRFVLRAFVCVSVRKCFIHLNIFYIDHRYSTYMYYCTYNIAIFYYPQFASHTIFSVSIASYFEWGCLRGFVFVHTIYLQFAYNLWLPVNHISQYKWLVSDYNHLQRALNLIL